MGSPDGYLKPLVALARTQAQEETGRGKRGTGSGGQSHGLDRRLLAHMPFQTPVRSLFRSPRHEKIPHRFRKDHTTDTDATNIRL